MTIDEVVGFCNHLYGETSWFLEDKEWVYLFTLRSKWLIKKNDYKRFGFILYFILMKQKDKIIILKNRAIL